MKVLLKIVKMSARIIHMECPGMDDGILAAPSEPSAAGGSTRAMAAFLPGARHRPAVPHDQSGSV
jgi:hypothetical protein